MGFPASTEPLSDIPFLRATSFRVSRELPRISHGESSGAPSESLSALEISTAQERYMEIYQQGGDLVFKGVEDPSPHQGGLLATISSEDGLIEIETARADGKDSGHASVDDTTNNTGDMGHVTEPNDTDTADGGRDGFWKAGTAPSWASDWGTDQYGHWANFIVEGNDNSVTQRMRWIMPGHFLMGSPIQEPERYDDEGPQYEVTVQAGFWLFDTTCTQSLWQTVMGNNPSRFKGRNRPVEQVSWNHIQEFLKRINDQIPGFDLVLPSEAEWEYSCRAGTTTPFCFGENITSDQVNYNGDHPYAGGETGLYRKCTVPVTSLPPNPWGLYEMHGNIWEWTRDSWHNNHQEMSRETPNASLDSKAPLGGADAGRVVRGGSWHNVARIVRSAVRDQNRPDDYSSNLGFRCARIKPGDEPTGMESTKTKPESSPDAVSAPKPTSVSITPSDTITRETRIRIGEISPYASFPAPIAEEFSVHADREYFTFRTETKPEWASAMGRDRFGLWAELSLESVGQNASISGYVTQRLRWIPPGRFIMGSSESERKTFPEYERERWCNREAPRHRVILTCGYWLFDTPCTQALWEMVMGNNPSRFQSPERPVESVSWEDANQFMGKINKRVPGLALILPTEAQWEYACRAGSHAATYAGSMEILGSNNIPVLDSIACYGGNSGVGFELDNGYDSSDWREKQYDHERAGTHPVGKKNPNPWGLHDMLGNVWEWCWDGQRDYREETVIDPQGPMAIGAGRMVRGGSWYYFARYARAASRARYLPVVRVDRIGFRCAQP
uniref:Formylglycine-generating enzyme, required for sulfatase activity, contains SUMF1/FGE domain n=1 Tax=Candidatus Kentrum sp. SD TaxID=2126332 RepID=A0A450YPE9_9GAMM|nr:MAG: Formylglycine-generating enzyme, required for sulfatase activity, contains SUMF1/FGE domain [Candidatus Kentron sp. SD]VFK43395.1 MAG: Formylglycine-generating enzyme, required for sulfatase activity, contains SUMF1/FGE domain [Candidatus Kentron sp. SD]